MIQYCELIIKIIHLMQSRRNENFKIEIRTLTVEVVTIGY